MQNDLISRSALRKLYSGWIPQLALPEDERDKKAIKICIAVLDEAPTIDPESLRPKGRWEEHHTSRYGAPAYVCSCCYDIWESVQIKNMQFCPSCGAKMEGGARMAKCRDCLHYEACCAFCKIINAARNVEQGCEHFKDRADVVEVVRCKDCKYYDYGKRFPDIKFCCRLKDKDGEVARYNYSDDDFCSYGERRADDGK